MAVPLGLLDAVAAFWRLVCLDLALGMRKEEEPFEVLRAGFNLRCILLLLGGFANGLLSRFIFSLRGVTRVEFVELSNSNSSKNVKKFDRLRKGRGRAGKARRGRRTRLRLETGL